MILPVTEVSEARAERRRDDPCTANCSLLRLCWLDSVFEISNATRLENGHGAWACMGYYCSNSNSFTRPQSHRQASDEDWMSVSVHTAAAGPGQSPTVIAGESDRSLPGQWMELQKRSELKIWICFSQTFCF